MYLLIFLMSLCAIKKFYNMILLNGFSNPNL